MKRETVIIAIKGICYLSIGIFTPWAASLAQWANADEWPSKIIWVGVILPASAIGGATQLLAFFSSSWKTYSENGKHAEPTAPTTETKP